MEKLYAVGLGPGPKDLLTYRASEVLRAADLVYSFMRYDSRATGLLRELVGHERIRLREPTSRQWGDWAQEDFYRPVAGEIRQLLDQGKRVAWACAGDVGVYSPFSYLEPFLQEAGVEWEIVPGVSFLNAFASTVGRHGNERTSGDCVQKQGGAYHQLHEDRQLALF